MNATTGVTAVPSPDSELFGWQTQTLEGGYTTVDAPGSAGFNDAHGINLAGQIVGIYSDANGRFHGFLATPVPEPSTLLLAGIGTFSLVGCLWCGRGQPVSWKS